MALDLAIDSNGDLVFAPNRDLDVRTGQATVDQRIRVRLMIYGGEWMLDPTGGQLGSRLHDALRLPLWQAREQIGLIVREALEPMDDIRVRDVDVTDNPDDSRALDILILYAMLDDQGITTDTALSTTFTIQG